MNSTTCAARRELFFCLGCDRWHHGNGQYASLPVFIPSQGFKYELCPTCEMNEQGIALEMQRQRLDIEMKLRQARRGYWAALACCAVLALCGCASKQSAPEGSGPWNYRGWGTNNTTTTTNYTK